MRKRGAPDRPADEEALEVRTEWAGGLSATAARHPRRQQPVIGANAPGPALSGRLLKDDVEVGRLEWDAGRKAVAWSFPGLTEGYVDAERLAPVGGWPFRPDLAWTNVQSYAFHHFHTLMVVEGQVAQKETGWFDRLLEWAAPTVVANEPGCDGLHWLDGSIFRPCCDDHDRCYEKYGCSSRSWWTVDARWACRMCNVKAVFCFLTTSLDKDPYRRY
jgi:hypothetical protein